MHHPTSADSSSFMGSFHLPSHFFRLIEILPVHHLVFREVALHDPQTLLRRYCCSPTVNDYKLTNLFRQSTKPGNTSDCWSRPLTCHTRTWSKPIGPDRIWWSDDLRKIWKASQEFGQYSSSWCIFPIMYWLRIALSTTNGIRSKALSDKSP